MLNIWSFISLKVFTADANDEDATDDGEDEDADDKGEDAVNLFPDKQTSGDMKEKQRALRRGSNGAAWQPNCQKLSEMAEIFFCF